MNQVAFKVVFQEGKDVYISAIERCAKWCVFYRLGQLAMPNAGTNQFLCIFGSLRAARKFRDAIFPRKVHKRGVILEVAAFHVTKTAYGLDGKRIPMAIDGHLFCRHCVPIRVCRE